MFAQEKSSPPLAESAKPPPPQPGEEPVDAGVILRALSERWRASNTVEYRSRAVAEHLGEPRVALEIHARLRRPGYARIVLLAGRPEYSRVRVSDGRRVTDRLPATATRRAYTRSYGYAGSATADLSHPCDYAAYSMDQFFAPWPFYPAPTWGDESVPLRVTAVRYPVTDPKTRQKRRHVRLTFERGIARDSVTLDALSYSPIEVVRVGFHGNAVQELVREKFLRVALHANLPDALFRWTPADEAGETLRV
jgi:hypothetical protein